MSGTSPEEVRDLTPSSPTMGTPPAACDGCAIADVIERKEREARAAAWAGVLAAILGTMSWNEFGMVAGGIAGFVFGLYARAFARLESYASFSGGVIALVVLALRLAGWL